MLVSEAHLNILLDKKNLVLVGRKSKLYRRSVTDRLRSVFPEDRFVTVANRGATIVQSKPAAAVGTRTGYQRCLGGTNGQEAYQLVIERNPDMVLLVVAIPDLDVAQVTTPSNSTRPTHECCWPGTMKTPGLSPPGEPVRSATF